MVKPSLGCRDGRSNEALLLQFRKHRIHHNTSLALRFPYELIHELINHQRDEWLWLAQISRWHVSSPNYGASSWEEPHIHDLVPWYPILLVMLCAVPIVNYVHPLLNQTSDYYLVTFSFTFQSPWLARSAFCKRNMSVWALVRLSLSTP